jgi:cytochrome P450
MEAGSDTSRVTVGNIVAAAATDPRWVKAAREELDRICGDAKRLPGWDDRESLPYITAVVKESFRWRPNLTEIGAPTMLTKDDEYEGYKFPAGTVFTWNHWAIALSEKEYVEPERFMPERFLNGDLNNAMKGHWGFGPGMFSIPTCHCYMWMANVISVKVAESVLGGTWASPMFGSQLPVSCIVLTLSKTPNGLLIL